jgi:hypothetical protein
MAKQREEILVRYLADTRQYIKSVDAASDATDTLGKAADGTGNELQDMEQTSQVLNVTTKALGSSLDQTGQSAIDSATGFSGLGAATKSMGQSVANAAKGLSTFTKALIATGIGAAIAGIALLVVYWEGCRYNNKT